MAVNDFAAKERLLNFGYLKLKIKTLNVAVK